MVFITSCLLLTQFKFSVYFDEDGNPDINIRKYSYSYQIFMLAFLASIIILELVSLVITVIGSCSKGKANSKIAPVQNAAKMETAN